MCMSRIARILIDPGKNCAYTRSFAISDLSTPIKIAITLIDGNYSHMAKMHTVPAFFGFFGPIGGLSKSRAILIDAVRARIGAWQETPLFPPRDVRIAPEVDCFAVEAMNGSEGYTYRTSP